MRIDIDFGLWYTLKSESKRRSEMRKAIRIVLTLIFICTAAFSGWKIFTYYKGAHDNTSKYDALAKIVESAESEESGTSDKTDSSKENEENSAVSETDENAIIPELSELYSQNSDLIAWINIPDTNINYPVMQTKDDPDYYLHKGFDKEYSDYGCPYVAENCDVDRPSDNIIVYGHNMVVGVMFAQLEKFEDKDFWSEHKEFSFYTLHEKRKYEIFAVFKTTVYDENTDEFKYYQFVDSSDKEDFNAYVDKCKSLALFDTDVEVKYGDKLITLSTCEYSGDNSRLVVVAKQITD